MPFAGAYGDMELTRQHLRRELGIGTPALGEVHVTAALRLPHGKYLPRTGIAVLTRS
jgi:hypothetical protein